MTNEELVAEIYESHERQDRRPGVPPMCLDCAPLAWPCDAVRAATALEAAEARVKELEAQVKDFKCEQVFRISEMQELAEAQHRIAELEAGRDAATAAIERVRDLASSLRGRYAENSDAAYFTSQFLAALDGAPEPEWEYHLTEVETKREMTNPVYVLRGGVYLLDEHAGVLIDSAGNFSAKTKGNPRSLAVLLKAIAEDIEYDVEMVPVKGEADGA